MGTVFQPIFFPRWRVRFVFSARWSDGTSGPKLCGGIWLRTREEAEKHALLFLDGLFTGEFYDFQIQTGEGGKR